MSNPIQLTVGRLDGLIITPVANDGVLTHVHLTVDTLPGLRLILEAGAMAELYEVFGIMLRDHT